MVGAALLGVARVFIVTHFPSDVLVGALLGASTALMLVWLAKIMDSCCPLVWMPVRLASRMTDSVFLRLRELIPIRT